MNIMSKNNGEGVHKISTMTKLARISVVWSLGVSLFWVLFMWGFWSHGIFAMGLNAFVFLSGLLGLFIWVMHKKGVAVKTQLYWIIPLGLIILSYLIYDNPFLKIISILVMPISLAVFYNHAFLSEQKATWGVRFLGHTILRTLEAIPMIGKSVSLHRKLLSRSQKPGGVVKRALLGVVLFLIIAFTIVIPLLSSADTTFAHYMQSVTQWVQNIISTTAVYKIVVLSICSVLITAALSAWSKPFTYADSDTEVKHADPIITGIVLGGILVLYIFFLGIQIQRIWIGALPFEFKEAVYLVKSGFWQLFFLTVINIVIFFFTYKKTANAVQKILTAFTIASLLLLISAGHRMLLYVINYGFSYEKFFATYTVLFCAILFIWLISRLFVHKRADIVKFVLVLFIWMYGILTIFPVEQFVFCTNVALAQRPESHIRLYELTMLSPDVLGIVEHYQKNGALKEETKVGESEPFDWSPWIEQNQKLVEDKKWYETNIMNWIYLIGR